MFKLRILKSSAVRIAEPSLRDSFTDAEIATIAGLGTITHFTSGDPLMAEGTDGTHAFFITSGSAAVSRGDDVVAMVSKGDLIGEHALITGAPRNASVTVRMPMTALSFDRHQFARLRDESPKVKALCDELLVARAA